MVFRMRVAAAVAAVVFACSVAQAAVIVTGTNVNLARDDHPGIGGTVATHRLTVFQDTSASDYTDTWFCYDNGHLQWANAHLDESSEWYTGSLLTPFTDQAIASGRFAQLNNPTFSDVGPNILVGHKTFLLAFRTWASAEGFRDTPIYGWVWLDVHRDGSLNILDCAITYDAAGIIIGRDEALIPEPATLALLGLAPLAMLRRRQ